MSNQQAEELKGLNMPLGGGGGGGGASLFLDVLLMEFMYLLACQVRVAAGNSGICYCVCVMFFEH